MKILNILANNLNFFKLILFKKVFKQKLLFIIIIAMYVKPFCYGQQDSNYVKKTPISGSLSASVGKVEYWDSEKQKKTNDINYILALSAGFYLGQYYNLSCMFNLPMNKKVSKNMPWSPDYYFMLTRSKYAPNTFYWGYSNFQNNKYSNSLKLVGQSLASGNFFLGYIIKIPDTLMKYIKIHSTSKLSTSIQLNYAIKYYDKKNNFKGGLFEGKPAISFKVKYIVINNFFISGSIFYYPRQDIQLSWDSDYAYGFGYENWKPWRLSLSYSNYMNRFPWTTESPNSGFFNGTFALSFNYSINYKNK